MAQTHRRAGAEEYRAVLLIGPPGSGKGTQGRILGEVPGYLFVSIGNVLRSLEAHGAPREIRRYLEAGDLVPSERVIDIWLEHMTVERSAGFEPRRDTLVLDGLPRNVEQAEMLQPHLDVELVVHLACDDEAMLMERIRGRDADREDDARSDVIRHRFDVYREQTAPLFEWYPPEVVVAVDGSRSPLEVLGQIVEALTAGETPAPNVS